MRMDVSDLDLNNYDFCCVGKRSRTIGTIIGLFDTAFLTVTFVKSVQILRDHGFNLFATAAVSCVGVIYGLHILCIIASWYGFAKELSSWIVPKLVLKVTTVLLCFVLSAVLVYFITTDSYAIGNIIAKGFNADYYDHKAAIEMGALFLASISAGLTMAQIWMLVLLWYCYTDIRNKEITDLFNKKWKEEQKKERMYTTFM